jgi:hypothetical protein
MRTRQEITEEIKGNKFRLFWWLRFHQKGDVLFIG